MSLDDTRLSLSSEVCMRALAVVYRALGWVAEFAQPSYCGLPPGHDDNLETE